MQGPKIPHHGKSYWKARHFQKEITVNDQFETPFFPQHRGACELDLVIAARVPPPRSYLDRLMGPVSVQYDSKQQFSAEPGACLQQQSATVGGKLRYFCTVELLLTWSRQEITCSPACHGWKASPVQVSIP